MTQEKIINDCCNDKDSVYCDGCFKLNKGCKIDKAIKKATAKQQEKINQLIDNLNAMEVNKNAYKKECEEKDNDIEALREQIKIHENALVKTIDEKNKELKEKDREIKSMEKQLNRLQDELIDKADYDDLQRQISKYKLMIEKYGKQLEEKDKVKKKQVEWLKRRLQLNYGRKLKNIQSVEEIIDKAFEDVMKNKGDKK